MRGLILMPLTVALVAAAGVLICHLAGWNPHRREMLFAAGACLIAVEAGIVPLMLSHGAAQASVAQAGLLATLVHLLAAAAGAAVVMMGKLAQDQSFVFWLMPFYAVTLIGLVTCIVRAVGRAPVTPSLRK